uniref:peptidylprolyl isomerase n=1 Tax=Thaumasiovibrio occultus TaxID=1891184 RepID=UPI000B350BD5|nr:peptidylprolyl isomerase [Thaumasiovibrio occultus]
MRRLATLMLAGVLVTSPALATSVKVTTNLGDFTVELNEEKAPMTVENFLKYVDEGAYNGNIFHRVIPNFMVQAGGFDKDLTRLPSHDPVYNESDNGLANTRGTIAMARTSNPHSATRQFFVNVVDNAYLNGNPGRPGYAVFGEVTDGMDVVDAIAAQPTTMKNGMGDVPVDTVTIESVVVIND